jgi:2-polyprenyl-6-methoxyphenol hydroxylase-like FAD-dependent oxidoreductase
VGEVPIPSITTSWDVVWRALRRQLPEECYRPSMSIDHVEESDQYASAIFTDGSRVDADLIVAADGLFSTVRRQLLPGNAPSYAGYVAFRAAVTERDVPPEVREQIFNHMIFCFPGHGVTLSVPMARQTELKTNGRRTQVVWFRPVVEGPELRALFTDSEGLVHGPTIAPTLIRRDLINQVKREALELLPPQLSCLIGVAQQPLLQAIYDVESPKMAFGRVALLGDAAFTARPHVGTGVTKAALDAEALVIGLQASSDVPEGLKLYEWQRLRESASLVDRGKKLGTMVERAARATCSTRTSFDVDFRLLISQFGTADQTDATN